MRLALAPSPLPPPAAAERPEPGPAAAASPAAEAELLLAGELFTDAELQGLARARAVHRVLPGVYAAASGPSTPASRAAALWTLAGHVLAAGWTATGATAAWVLAGGESPVRLHAAVPHFHRLPAGGLALPWVLVESDVAAGPGGRAAAEADVVLIGPLRVTTAQRTVEDLLLTGDPDDVRRAARVMARHDADGLRARLARPTRRPGVVGARRRLALLLDALGLEG